MTALNPSLTTLQLIINTINQAESPGEAAQALTEWLGSAFQQSVVAILNLENAEVQLYPTPGFTVPDELQGWMQSADAWLNWQEWTAPRWHTPNEPVPYLSSNDEGLLLPLPYAGTVRGMIWVAARPQMVDLTIPLLLAGLLAARLDHLKTTIGWNMLVDKLNDFSRALVQKEGLQDIWDAVENRITELFDATSFFVGLYEPGSGLLTFPVVINDGYLVTVDPLPLQGASKAVITQGSPLYFRNLMVEQDRLRAYNTELTPDEPGSGLPSWLGVPLRNRNNEVTGLISVQSELPQHFSDSDLALLMLIALQISQTVENQRLLGAEQNRRKIASTLIEVSQVVSSTLDQDAVLDRILEPLNRLIQYDRASIMLPTVAPEGNRMTVAASQGVQPHAHGQEILLPDDSPGREVIL